MHQATTDLIKSIVEKHSYQTVVLYCTIVCNTKWQHVCGNKITDSFQVYHNFDHSGTFVMVDKVAGLTSDGLL